MFFFYLVSTSLRDCAQLSGVATGQQTRHVEAIPSDCSYGRGRGSCWWDLKVSSQHCKHGCCSDFDHRYHRLNTWRQRKRVELVRADQTSSTTLIKYTSWYLKLYIICTIICFCIRCVYLSTPQKKHLSCTITKNKTYKNNNHFSKINNFTIMQI